VKAFLIRLNGKRLWAAGIGPDGVLTAIIDWVGGASPRTAEGQFGLHVGGLDCRTGEEFEYETPGLKVGDKVSVEIIEADRVDPATKRHVPDLSGDG